MAHLSEAIPTPVLPPGHLWSLLGSADRTQWKWEAPTRRPTKTEGRASALPAWLSEWDTTPQEPAAEDLLVKTTTEEKCLVDGTPSVEEDVRRFRELLTGQSDADTQILAFNRRLEQNLTLGLVSSDLLAFTLRQVTDDLRKASKRPDIAQARCLAFYSSVWSGITNSKVFGPVDFDGKTIDKFIDHLSCLPSTGEVQSLVHHITSSLSISQLQCIEHGITSIAKTWSQSWLGELCTGDSQSAIQAAEDSVRNAEAKLSDAQSILRALKRGSKRVGDLTTAREAASRVHSATLEALEAISKAEQILEPFKASAKLLAGTLYNVPSDMLLRIASSCTAYAMELGGRRRRQQQTMRYCWLSTLAQLPGIDTQLFLETWKKLESSDGIREHEASDIILSRWISQGYVSSAMLVRNSFEATAHQAGKEDFACLLFALHKHRQSSLARTRELFLFLDDTGKYKRVYTILSRMKDLGLKVPMSCLGKAIDTMSNYDARLALKTFHLHRVMLLGDRRVRLDLIPNFIMALINDRGITPGHIWELLKIPLYEDLLPSQRHFKPVPLSKTMIDLIHKMALEFASSDARPSRVALRNVLQCLYHLRLHRAPIGPEISRAVTSIGIAEEIRNGKWIRQERLRYALRLINEVEGKKVAEEADGTVLNWRIYMSEKQAIDQRGQMY